MRSQDGPTHRLSRVAATSALATVTALVFGAIAHTQGQITLPPPGQRQLPPCGEPSIKADGGRPQPVFPAGQYPVTLPAVSPHGVHNDLPNPYRPGIIWGKLPAGRTWGTSASVTTAPDGTIWVVDRTDPKKVNPIIQLDTSGTVLREFGAGVFEAPHKMSHDADGNLWVADQGAHQVIKLSQDGKVLMTLGKKGVRGTGLDEFDAPADVVVAANGDIFVADGHTGGGTPVGNARVMKFDKNGKFLKTWGKKGMGPGEFDVLHALELDSRGRLFVGDRNNNRIQIFEPNGRFVAQWTQFGRPSGIHIDRRTDTIYVGDGESRDGMTNTGQFFLLGTGYGYNPGVRRGVRIGNARDGKVVSFIPDECPYPYPGGSSLTEGVTSDLQGNVYTADFLNAVRKFVKK